MKSHRPYKLESYNPEWRERFLKVAETLRLIFSKNLVEIDHVGSTSVDMEDMLAKPQIDILVVVRNLDLVKDLYGSLQEAGFTTHGRGYVTEDDEYLSKDGPDGSRVVSVHTLQEGNPKIRDYKVFRDYLKANTEDRTLYIQTKKDLYSLHSDNYASYDNGKKSVIQGIKERAIEWASSLGQ